MSNRDGANPHEVIGEIFHAMNTAIKDRAAANLPRWADAFPYVNGGLFSGRVETPRFSKIAQRYLSHIGTLDWTRINPDIFGSMIQAVADDDERSARWRRKSTVGAARQTGGPRSRRPITAALSCEIFRRNSRGWR
jgi:hypothetical protein